MKRLTLNDGVLANEERNEMPAGQSDEFWHQNLKRGDHGEDTNSDEYIMVRYGEPETTRDLSRHSSDSVSSENPIRQDRSTESSNQDFDMPVIQNQDSKTQERGGSQHPHRMDGDSLAQEAVLSRREKDLLKDPTEKGSQSGEGNHEASTDETKFSRKPEDDKDADTSTRTRSEASTDDVMDCEKLEHCKNDENATGTKMSDGQSNEKQTNKDGIEIPSAEKDVAMLGQDCNQQQDSDGNNSNIDTPSSEKYVTMLGQDRYQHKESNKKNDDSNKREREETKEAPKLSQVRDSTQKDLEAKKPKSDSGEALSLPAKCVLADKKNDDTSSLYPLDGQWEMEWKLFPANNKTFNVHKHVFQIFDHPCEIIWLADTGGSCCANFQWPEAVTTVETPIFQQSQLGISRENTSIQWTTTDPQYGEIIWKRLDSTKSKAQIAIKQDNVMAAVMYPLDGIWLLTWKSFYLYSSTIVVQNHKLQMFDYACEIKFGPTDNFFPSFQWPVEVTSIDSPIFQKCKLSFPPNINRTELPNIIGWTISDSEYGEATWTRLNTDIPGIDEILNRKRKSLAEEAKAAVKKMREEEELQFKSSMYGKAWDLVAECITLSSQMEHIDTIAKDDMVYLAERLLMAQEDFQNRKIPSKVDIAYHHTQSSNLETIRTNGLLSRREREERNINSNFNGSARGEGIYCSEDPAKFANQRYGDTTILLARMKGVESRAWRSNKCDTSLHHHFCVVKSCSQCVPLFKFPSILLGPHVRGDNSDAKDGTVNFREKLGCFHQLVQSLLDKIFNDNVATTVNVPWALRSEVRGARRKNFNSHSPFPPATAVTNSRPPSPPVITVTKCLTMKEIESCSSVRQLENAIRYNKSPAIVFAATKRLMTINPSTYARFQKQINMSNLITHQTQTNTKQQIPPSHQNQMLQSNPFAVIPDTIRYDAPNSLTITDENDLCRPCLTYNNLAAHCPTCKIPLFRNGKVVQIAKCGHIFHRTCLKNSMEKQPYCPICSVPVSNNNWRGTMPSGTMTISQDSSHCDGFDGFQTVVICYSIPSGHQRRYHPKPGSPFTSNGDIAYVPASAEGMKLVNRLKFAFSRGLTFKIRDSGFVDWAISHKTSQRGPSYPDALYIARCNNQLDFLNVPSAVELSTAPNYSTSGNGLPQISSAVAASATTTARNFANSPPTSWQSSADNPDRRRLINSIFQILQPLAPDKSRPLQRCVQSDGTQNL